MKSTRITSTGGKSNRRKNKMSNPKQQQQPNQCLNDEQKKLVLQKMRSIQKNRFKASFQQFYGNNAHNSPIQERQLLSQQWENIKKETTKFDMQIIQYKNSGQIIFSALTMLCYTFTVWLGTVDFFFGGNKTFFVSREYYIAPMVVMIADSILSGNVKTIINEPSNKNKILKGLLPFLCLLYFSLKFPSLAISQEIYWLILQLPCLYHLYSRASQFYQSFRVMSLSKKFEYHVKSFDLIFSLVLISHVISIILFQMTRIESEGSWLSKLNLKDQNSLILYIYSFYFGCTTILTVGYGDIVPANHIQIAVVCLVELFGIALFAYLLSEIGYNLSNLRKDREIIQKDLAVLQKCRVYYKIHPDIVTKAKLNILNSQQAVNRLKPDEEKALASKLSEPLRQEVTTLNNLSILKSSIFFLCRWSKSFQRTLSQNLISSLYMPGESFFQPEGKQRIYIIRLGKVNFYRKQKGKNEAQKIIKTVKVDLKKEVSNNSFGYTSVIGKKTAELQAVSSDFTSAYYVDKQKFLASMAQNSIDFEYYHEIRDKIQQTKCPQSLEIPALTSRKFHYNPFRACLVKRHFRNKNLLKNDRTDLLRRQKRFGTKDVLLDNRKQPQVIDKVRKDYISSIDEITLREQLEHHEEVTNSHDSTEYQQLIAKQIERSRKTSLNYETFKYFQSKEQKPFDQMYQEYSNYYPVQNLEQILRKYDQKVILSRSSSFFDTKQILTCLKNKITKEL